MTYLDGLQDAAALCAARSSDHSRNAAKLSSNPAKEAARRDAFEALECALSIHRLAREAEQIPETPS